MSIDYPSGWAESELSWMAQHLDAVRTSYQGELRRLLLGVIETRDLLQRILASSEIQTQSEQWQTCVHAMEQKFQRLLESFGVETLPAKAPVDPLIHHVVGVSDQPGDAGAIAEVLLSGYRWNDSLLRAAEVIAFRPSAPDITAATNSQGGPCEIDRH